jgi:hypothetical protein
MAVRLIAAALLWLTFGAFSFQRTDFDAPGTSNQQLFDVAIADLGNPKGKDIVVSAYARNTLVLLRNLGGGAFAQPVERNGCGPANDGPWQIVAGHFNAGPAGDIAVACGFVTLVPGDGAGELLAPQKSPWTARGSITAGELNGGGAQELVFGTPGPTGVVLCFTIQLQTGLSDPNCGNPMDPQPPLLQNVQAGPRPGNPTPVVAELDKGADQHDEVFGLSTTTANAITVYAREGPTYDRWTWGTRTTSTNAPYFVSVGDIEGDGDNDVLVGHHGGGVFDLFRSSAGGLATQPQVTNTLTFDNQDGRLADFDGDGWLDAVVVGGQGQLFVHRGLGDGTFDAPEPFGVVGASSNVALDVGDVSGDGRPDIVVSERHALVNTPDRIAVLIDTTLKVTSPPPGGGGGGGVGGAGTTLSPAIKGIPLSPLVDRKGHLVVGKATNPPTATTTQTLAAGHKLLGRGHTTIAAGMTKALRVTLNRKGLKRLRRAGKLRVRLTIKATGPTGLTATVHKRVKLKARKG